MGGSSSPKQPAPIDPGESMGEYLFGKGFKSFEGITDPRLQDRLIGAEATYRPQYAALELADINTFATGLAERANPEYEKIQGELAALRAGQELQTMGGADRKAALEAQALKLFPLETMQTKGRRGSYMAFSKENEKQRKEYIKIGMSGAQDREARIAQLETQLESTPERLDAQKGLFDLLKLQSEEAGKLQRSELGKQRQADVDALREFSPQVVQANRDADPFSTMLANEATDRAMDPRLAEKGQALLDAKMVAASAAESALNQSGLSNINAKREAASAAERELNKVGMSLSDLEPTEQEAILSGRGMEFAASTGELTALEKRRAQQSSREASIARGRGMDQSAVYGEMEARMAEELNKQEREIALGASLLGQQADMRLNRLGKGAGILGQAEAMNAQRRAEQLQRQKFGASSLAQAGAMEQQRRDYQLQQQKLGSDLLARADQQLAGAFALNRNLAGDAGNVILGRPSASVALGGQMLGQAQQAAAGPMGPQLFDPNVGLNMALQQRGQDVTFQGMQAQADAASSAGMMGGLGSALGAFTLPCWVAREVYGIENPKWLEFREWMLNDSPSWFRNTYIKYGERFAKFISNKPRIKSIIRKWMNTKIK